MRKKKALSDRELKTEKILQAALPEYTIRANMRLADVVHAGNRFKYMSSYHLDFVICDEHTYTIAAVELDDSSHDTEDGKRRDANKNKWLQEEGIPLVRLRNPEEARNIRSLISAAQNQDYRPTPQHDAHKQDYQPIPKDDARKKPGNRIFITLAVILAVAGVSTWVLNGITQNMLNTGKTAIATQQTIQPKVEQKNQLQIAIENLQIRQEAERVEAQREAETLRLIEKQLRTDTEYLRKQKEAERAEAQRRAKAQQPRYERVLVKGKSILECSSDKIITNETIRCMKDHYEMVLVSVTQ